MTYFLANVPHELFVSFVSFDDHLMTRITRIFCVFCVFCCFLTADNAKRRKNFFSCPSHEPLYISAHFCVFCGFFYCQRITRITRIISFIRFIWWLTFINNYLWNLCNLLTFIIQFHVHFYLRVLRVLRWQTLTMSNVSHAFFVPLLAESSGCFSVTWIIRPP